MAKSKKRLQAIELRRSGESIKKIASLLAVSPSSVSSWCRDIILTPAQIQNLQIRRTDPYYGKKQEYLERKRQELDKKIMLLKQQGIDEVGNLTKREIFLVGIALYWGEGFKKDHQVGFANSDVRIAKFFMYWLKECFSLRSSGLIFRVTVNAAYKEKIRLIQQYWAEQLNVPVESFSKPFFQNTTWKKEYENKDEYHGVIRIRVRSSMDFLRKIYGYIDGLTLNLPN